MSKANALLHQENTCQVFKAWVLNKGVDHLKKGNLKDHLVRFEEETGLRISPLLAHSLIARLVRQNRKAKESRVTTFFLLHPSLRGQFC